MIVGESSAAGLKGVGRRGWERYTSGTTQSALNIKARSGVDGTGKSANLLQVGKIISIKAFDPGLYLESQYPMILGLLSLVS